MKPFYLSFFFLCTALNAVAQNPYAEVELSEESKEPGGTIVYDMIGTYEDAYYLARVKPRRFGSNDIMLEKYGSDLKMQRIKELNASVDGEELDFNTAYFLQDKLYALGYGEFRDHDQKVAYILEVDPSDLSTPGKPRETLVIEDVRNQQFLSFETLISREEEMVAFVGLPGARAGNFWFNKKKRENVEAQVAVFNENMNEVWKSGFRLPYQEKDYAVVGTEVDDEGNLYFLGRYNNEGPGVTYKIQAFRNNGKELVEYDVDLADKLASDCALGLSLDGNLIVTGFYSDNKVSRIAGAFYLLIDPASSSKLLETYKEFDTETLALFMKKRKAEKGKELDNFTFDRVIMRTDGGAVLLGEKFYITQSTTTDAQGNTRVSYTYHHNEIIVVNINPDGTIEWVTKIPKIPKIPKIQSSSSSFYLGYSDHVKDENIFLVFNDNEKNLGENAEDKISRYNGNKSIATLVTILPDGTWNKTALFDNKEQGVLLRPSVAEQLNETQMLIYAERGKKYKLGLLTFR